MNRYEDTYMRSKLAGGLLHVGYHKLGFGLYSFLAFLIVIWFSTKVGLFLLGLSIVLTVLGHIEKRIAFKRMDKEFLSKYKINE